MREINILGLSLHDYTLREKMRMLDGFLDHGVPGTVEFVSAKVLMRAESDARHKEWLESMDIIEYCDADILRAAGITSRGRMREIENNSFLYELLRRLVRERRPVYLLADSQNAMLALESDIQREQIEIVGKNILSSDEGAASADQIINDINDKAPDAILTLTDCFVREAFIYHNKNRINAGIWVGLSKEGPVAGPDRKRMYVFVTKLQKKLFQRKVHRYENQGKAEN